MALAAETGPDSLFLSISSVASLLGRFHPCGGRSSLLLSRRPGGAVVLGCHDCHTHVDCVRDELAPLLRRRTAELQRALGLDEAAQERLLDVLRGQQEPDQQRQHTSIDPLQRGLHHQQQGPQHDADTFNNLQHQQQQQWETRDSLGSQQEQAQNSKGSHRGQDQPAENTLPPEKKKTKTVYKSVRCEVCSKVFYKRSNLRVHMLIHLGVRPHWCQKCGKNFSDPSTYSRHVASVCGGQRHLACHMCGKTFYHQLHLKEHVRVHTGDKHHKPFSCEGCGKNYACQGSLRRHRRVQCPGHGAAGAHRCPICGKAFRRPDALTTHCRLHAVVAPPPGRLQQQQLQQQRQHQQQQQQEREQEQQQLEQQRLQHSSNRNNDSNKNNSGTVVAAATLRATTSAAALTVALGKRPLVVSDESSF